MALPNNSGVVVVIAGQDDLGPVLDRLANENLTRFQKSAQAAGDALSSGMSHSVTQVAAASAAIREFEGNLPIRAVERFLSTTLDLGPILAKAFPVFGGIAFIGMLGKVGEELHSLEVRARGFATAVQRAFDDAIAKQRDQAAQLAVNNDRLEDTIAKLEHKPADGLRAGLDEARVEAGKLDDAIRSAIASANDLFSQKAKVGLYDKLVHGTKDTKDIRDEVIGSDGESGALGQVDQIRHDYAPVIQGAIDSGNSKAHIDELNQLMLARIQDVLEGSKGRLEKKLKETLDQQYDEMRLGGDGKRYQTRINALRGGISYYSGLETNLGEQYRASIDGPAAAKAHDDHANDERENRLKDARSALGVAQAATQEAQNRADAARQKAADDVALAALETKHREMLISDSEFYKQRASLQASSILAEHSALISDRAKQVELALALQRPSADPVRDLERKKQLEEIGKRIAEIDAKDAALTAQTAKNVQATADAEYERAKALKAEGDQVAARLESETGASTDARKKRINDLYAEQAAGLRDAGPDVIAALSGQRDIDLARIDVEAADAQYGLANAGIQAARRANNAALGRGQQTSAGSRRASAALDRQEAGALEQTLPAWQALADTGDLNAKEKIIELRERIEELKNPVNEVAGEIRGQFDSAFESLFENLDRGKRAFEDLGKALEHSLIKDAYQQFVEPTIQKGLSSLLPNGSKRPTTASALAGILPKIAGIAPTAAGARKGAAPIEIRLLNQTSTPMKMSGEGQQGDLISLLEPAIKHVMLNDLSTNGTIAQALSGLGGLLA